MKIRRLPHLAAILLAAAVCAGPVAVPAALAQARDAAVGADGELYVVREGTYGALFPQQGLVDPGNRVLALEIVRSEGGRQRLLVPGTESDDVEDSASILFEDQSGTLFALWQTMARSIHSRLVLIGLRGGEWSEPIEISGSPFGWKSSPQLAVTRDTFRIQESDGSLRSWNRTVAHLLWWEEGVGGGPRVYYSPVTFLDGDYTGWNPVYPLDTLELAAGGQAPLAPNLALAEAPKIVPGRNEQSVVLGFVDGSGGRLISVEIELMPGEIAFIADKIRHQIIDIGRTLGEDEPASLAGKIRHQIIDIGNRIGLHPSLSAYAAQQAASEILESPPGEGLASLAERVRHQIIDIGARVTDRGFDRLAAKSSVQVLEIPNGEAADPGAPANLIRVVQASARPIPDTGSEEIALLLARSGRDVLVAWSEEGAVHYRESRGEGWSPARRLGLGANLSPGRAHEILKRRVEERSSVEQ